MPIPGRHATRIGFAVAALILVAVGTWAAWASRQSLVDASWVAHTQEVLGQLDTLSAVRREVTSAQRGYLLTRRAEDRNDYWKAKAQVDIEVRRLRELVGDNTAQRRIVDRLAPLLRERMALSERTVAVFEAEDLAAAQRFIVTNGSGALDARIDAIFADADAQERGLLASRRAVSDRSAVGVLVAAVAGIPLSLAILAVIYRVLIRENAQRRRSEALAGSANLELARSVSQAQRLSGEMEGLSRYAGMLQGCTEIGELMAVTESTLRRLLPDSAGTVYLLKPSRDYAEAAAQWGVHRAASSTHPRPQDCWAVRRNQPYACADVANDVHCQHVETTTGAPVATQCLPLSAQGELMGWLYLSGPGPGPLREAALALQAAEQFSLALANLRLKDVLRQQSIRDPLTSLFNRRYLEESLAREIARCQRRELPLAVLMLDLDHFKAFNDRHGHGGGDALLTAFARVLQASCRAEDIPCRFGGEEFTLILPEADEALALERAQKVLHETAQLVVQYHDEPLSRVTASIGIATLPRHGTSATALMAAADAALYQSKARGRNRATVAETTT